jgi:hypothetical protein
LTTFTSIDLANAIASAKIVEEAPYHPGYEDAVVNPDEGRPLSVVIRERMINDKKRFWAGDNISDYVSEKDKERLIDEATQAFEKVLDTLLIDRTYDPNSHGTARRLAKMYYNEIMAGRYDPAQTLQRFLMIVRIDMKACWWFVVSCAVCVVIIINPLLALLILALLPLKNLLDYQSTHVLPNGVLDEVLSRRNFVMILLGKSKKPQAPKT